MFDFERFSEPYLRKLYFRFYIPYNNYMDNNIFLRKIIYSQHNTFPMPLVIFDFLFRSRIIKYIFNFYGAYVWKFSYDKRDGDNLSYWLSKESLYWHFWRQTDVDNQNLNAVLAIPQIKQCMQNDSLVAVELGFGIGKNYGKRLKNNRFNKYIAIELNKFLCDYVGKKFKSEKNLHVVNQSINDFIKEEQKFDVLFCSGGVFMYLNKETVDSFLRNLPKRGVKIVIIFNEGTWKSDIKRLDNTTMYNFKERLEIAGYKNKTYIEERNENDLYKYFVMY